ncbi:MAG: hypothetical protein ACLVB5_11185 [Christensenellales bacterium]
MRAFETQAEMLFSAVTDDLRALLRRMLDQGLQSDAQLCEKLAALLRDGREAEARALAEQADESALVAALQTLEDHARADFMAVRLSPPTRSPSARRRANGCARFSTRSAHLWKTP